MRGSRDFSFRVIFAPPASYSLSFWPPLLFSLAVNEIALGSGNGTTPPSSPFYRNPAFPACPPFPFPITFTVLYPTYARSKSGGFFVGRWACHLFTLREGATSPFTSPSLFQKAGKHSFTPPSFSSPGGMNLQRLSLCPFKKPMINRRVFFFFFLFSPSSFTSSFHCRHKEYVLSLGFTPDPPDQ